jgi:hypothetical protein
MTVFYIIRVASSVLLPGAVAFLALIVIGVCKGDRRNLTSPPSSHIHGITRSVVGLGVRHMSEDES